jgi:chromosome segregation ATPase
MSTESDSNTGNSSDEGTMSTSRPEDLRNLIRICKTYHFFDLEKVYDLCQLRALVTHLSRDLRDKTNENKLLYKFRNQLMGENEKLKLTADADLFYRNKVNQLMTGNRDAMLKLNQQQNQIVEMCTFLEEQREKFSNMYVDLVKQSQNVVEKFNSKLGQLEGEKKDLQAKLTDAAAKLTDAEATTAKLMNESNVMRQKCDEYLGEDAEKLSQIEGLQSRIESLLNDHQRIAEQMAENNHQQKTQIEQLQRANIEQAQQLQNREDEVTVLTEKLAAQNTVVLYQKKLMQELTTTKNELTSKLVRE